MGFIGNYNEIRLDGTAINKPDSTSLSVQSYCLCAKLDIYWRPHHDPCLFFAPFLDFGGRTSCKLYQPRWRSTRCKD